MTRRGAQSNPVNQFDELQLSREITEGIDDWESPNNKTQYFKENPRNILSKNNSSDIPFDVSINPYQGCEHGCIYCYARNTHEYWGYSAGIDFESKILIKENAPALLERALQQRGWKPQVVALSGNTDCYQPAERRLEITRKLLELFLRYRNPVGIITKNALILRDIDLLAELAKLNLVHVNISITTMDESLRRTMEPRTVPGEKRLSVVEQLTASGIPVGVMVAPIIPWLNHHEIPSILKLSADAGARSAGYTVVRLNGAVSKIFTEWVNLHYPGKADRVLNAIKEFHDGKLNDSDWGRRLKGDGNLSSIISQLFAKSMRKYFYGRSMPEYNLLSFRKQGNYGLFE